MPIGKSATQDKFTLTIAIPTFNRAPKVKRLLRVIKEEIVAFRLEDRVAVIVSDNASTDATTVVVSEFLGSNFKLEYCRQPENLGFDGNLEFLYSHAMTQYVWYISDDDMPCKGAIFKIVNVLERDNPDVMLFSFIQPPGSTVRQFDYPEPVHLIADPIIAIEHVLRYTKLSIFVIRKIDLDNSQRKTLQENIGGGWYYLSLTFSVLETSQNLVLAVISEPLATCDEDYTSISYTPSVFLNIGKMAQHPFVIKHQPNLYKFYEYKGYCQSIQFAFAAKVGSLSPEYPEEYDIFIKELECKISILLKYPRSLFQFIALKMRITGLWPKIRHVFDR